MEGVGTASQVYLDRSLKEFVKAPGKALHTTEKFPYHFYDNMSLSYIHILLQTDQCSVLLLHHITYYLSVDSD